MPNGNNQFMGYLGPYHGTILVTNTVYVDRAPSVLLPHSSMRGQSSQPPVTVIGAKSGQAHN